VDIIEIPNIIDDDEDELDDDENDIGPFSEDDNIEIIIEEDDDLEDDDIEILEKTVKDVKKFIRENKVTPKNYVIRKNELLREIKKNIKELDLLVLSQAYLKKDTFSGFIIKHKKLRKELLKSFLARMDEDAKVIIYQELYRDACGDDEPIDFYIS